MRKDYYLILGVPRTESPSGMRAAFRTLVKRYHPERIGSQGATFLHEILTAYHVLSDPEKRRLYDEGLLHAEGKMREAGPTINVGREHQEAPRLPATMRELHVSAAVWPPIESLLSHVRSSLAQANTSHEQSLRSFNIQVVLSSDEATRGGIAAIPIPVFYPCAACGGSGREGMFSCSKCDAQGVVEDEEVVRVRIPAMVEDYCRMEIPVRGLGLHNICLRLYIRVAP